MSDGDFTTQMQPNSANQTWSKWEFGIQANPRKLPPKSAVHDNACRYFAAGFKSTAGRVRTLIYRTPLDAQLLRQGTLYYIECIIEGPPVLDPGYRESVRRDFIRKFVEPGFGTGAELVRFQAKLLAGDRGDGLPPEQMIVLPTIDLRSQFSDEEQRVLKLLP